MQSIQAGQVGLQQSIESVCDKHTEGLQELAGLMDQKLESAASNLKAEIRTVQVLLQNAISENSTRRGIQSQFETDIANIESGSTTAIQNSCIVSQQKLASYSNIFICLEFFYLSFLITDIEGVLRAGNNIAGIARSKWLFVTPRFHYWVCEPERRSDLILVHGQLCKMAEGKISALSVLAALSASTRKGRFSCFTTFAACILAKEIPLAVLEDFFRA